MKKMCVVFVFIFVCSVSGLDRPSFIGACNRNDSNLDDCALAYAKKAIPELVKGSTKYSIPKMNPMHLDFIKLAPTANLHLKVSNITVSGLDLCVPTLAHFDLEKRDAKIIITTPILDISGHYEMSGRLIVFPIEGNGFANVTYINGTYVYDMHFELPERKNIKYINQTVHGVTLEVERAYFNFTNLFNGNKVLADQVLQFMDENWKEVNKDFGSLVAKAIDSIAHYTSNAILGRVPYDQVFLP